MPLSSEEIEAIKRILGRDPRPEELAMFEAQWSEHCSYKSSRKLLKLLPTRKDYVILGPGRDAPAVEVFPGISVVFKIESHNHPSAVDPYNGAATGIGGIVRDILTLGAKPIALLDLLYLGNPSNPHANWLIRGIVKGISDYGNRIGVPTVAGDTWFDDVFNKQPLVNVACVGVASNSKLVLEGPKPGDAIVIIGNATGRDGILGSSFASKPLSEDTDREIGAVQVGDPLTEKVLIDVLQELTSKSLVRYIKDLGGGGLTTAVSESAADYGLGTTIHIDKLHLREQLTPLEILISESQERMLLAIEPRKLSEVIKILNKYDLAYSVIGYFDDSGRIRVYYKDKLVADVPARELARPQALRRASRPPQEALKGLTPIVRLPKVNIKDAIVKLISSPNIASKRWIYEQYDHEVGIRTVIKPGHGDATVLRILDGSKRGIAIKGDVNPRYTSLDPFNGAANSVAECFRNLVSVNSTPLAIVDELNAGSPEKPEQFWYFEEMVKGIAWMASELGLPVVGGKVSFYNEDEKGHQIKPTATIVGIGRVDDISKSTSLALNGAGNYIAVIGVTYPELGGSEYLYRIHGLELGEIPRPRPASELRHAEFIKHLISEGIAISVHDVSIGGLAIAVIEMAIAGGLGVELHINRIPTRGIERIDEVLFSETQARYIVEIKADKVTEFKELSKRYGVEGNIIGKVLDKEAIMIINDGKTITSLSLPDLTSLYNNSLKKLMEW